MLSKDGLYRHLYRSSEQHGDKKGQSIDFTWIKNTYRLDSASKESGNCNL